MKFPRKVYAIQHNKTKKIYIGSSHNPEKRYMAHIYSLRNNNHPVDDMQYDFNKYGEDYSFYILDEIKSFDEKVKEYEWMKKYQSFIAGIGYNYKDKKFPVNMDCIPYKSGLPENISRKE